MLLPTCAIHLRSISGTPPKILSIIRGRRKKKMGNERGDNKAYVLLVLVKYLRFIYILYFSNFFPRFQYDVRVCPRAAAELVKRPSTWLLLYTPTFPLFIFMVYDGTVAPNRLEARAMLDIQWTHLCLSSYHSSVDILSPLLSFFFFPPDVQRKCKITALCCTVVKIPK